MTKTLQKILRDEKLHQVDAQAQQSGTMSSGDAYNVVRRRSAVALQSVEARLP